MHCTLAWGEDAPGKSKAAARAGKVRKLLAEVRRDAGRVRDCDVQLELVEEAVGSGAGDGLQVEGLQGEGDGLQGEGTKLRAWLKRKRASAAGTLLKDLHGHALQLAPRMEALIRALEPAAQESVSRERLLTVTRQWHAGRTRGLAGKRGEQALHDRRKAAKVARYLLEAAGPGGGLRKAAAMFEAVQESGGAWHDNLVLRRLAGKRLGKKSLLAVLFGEREEAALIVFRQHLEGMPHAVEASQEMA